MPLLVLILSLIVPFAALAWVAWRAHARLRDKSRLHRVACDEASEDLASLQACVESSRESSHAVLRQLERTLRAIDPAVDALVAFTPDGNELRCSFASGVRAEHFVTARVARDAQHHLVAHAAALRHHAVLSGSLRPFMPTDRRALAIPLCDADGLRGLLYASSSSDMALARNERVARIMLDAGLAYTLACEREADRADATYDALTGLLTPRAFRDHLHAELAPGAQATRIAASLWFIDTDNFKRVNDEFGHAMGDVVLQGMADVLRAHTFVDVDIAGRNGGDEFCALVRESQKTVAIERAHALCVAIRERDFGIPLRVTASIGVATFPHDARSSNALLEAADGAMYFSKRHGRDRVSFAVDAATYAVYR